MQDIVDFGNTNGSDGNTAHGMNTQCSKLLRSVRIYPFQLQFLKNLNLKIEL